MAFDHLSSLSELKEILLTLKTYPGGLSKFVSNFQNLTGLQKHRNFPSKILSGEISFSGKLFHYLPEAHEAAHKALEQMQVLKDRQKRTEAKLTSYHSIIDKKLNLQFLENQLARVDELYLNGQIAGSTELQRSLIDSIDPSVINKSKQTAYLIALLYINFARNLCQFAGKENLQMSLLYLRTAENILKSLHEPLQLYRLKSIQGLILRQQLKFSRAFDHYLELESFIHSARFLEKDKNILLSNTKHQRGITLMRKASQLQDCETLMESTKLLQSANEAFKDRDDLNWYKHCQIREAESYIQSGKISEADELVGKYEDYTEIALLNPAQQSIFFRLNTEKYARLNNIEKALSAFRAAVTLAYKHGFQHELEQMARVLKRYSLLRKNISPGFSVFEPNWSLVQ